MRARLPRPVPNSIFDVKKSQRSILQSAFFIGIIPREMTVEDALDIFGGYFVKDDKRLTRNVTVHEGLFGTKAEAAHLVQANIHPPGFDGMLEGIVHFLSAVSQSACAGTDGDLRDGGKNLLQTFVTEFFQRGCIAYLHDFTLLLEIFVTSFWSVAVVTLL